jgi:two-component system, OmpR family, phosphate regulon sensor histidine kinase PhoR
MVGVPAALHLAAALLAVFAAAGLAVALLAGRPQATGRGDGALRRVGALGALAYGVGAALAGAQVGPADVRTWVQAAGLLLVALGTTRAAAAGLPLVVPVVPTTPALAAAGAALLAAARVAAAGPRASALALGLAVLGGGHALEPSRPVLAAGVLSAGSLLVGVWLWTASRRRLLAKLLVAFAASLLALATVLAAVLSTASSAQLAEEELGRLRRLAQQLTAEVESWPGEAVLAAQPLARSADPLVTTALSPADAADLYALSLSSQDFFLAIDASGQVVNSHPPTLSGAVRLAVVGDPRVAGLLAGGATGDDGGLLISGDAVVAIGAVALSGEGTRPEGPPAGVLVTGRRVDGLYVAQVATELRVGVVAVVGGQPLAAAVPADAPGEGDGPVVDVDGPQVAAALGERPSAEVDVGGRTAFAAADELADPELGTVAGRIVTVSTPAVIADLETAQTRRLFLVSLVGGALALVVAAVVVRRSTRPISRLTAVAEAVSAGDLGRRSEVEAPDEVGVLSAAFDEMVESLSEQQRDLTTSAQREARLRGRFESLTTSMSDGLVAADASGEVITFNPAAEALLGLPADSAVGRPLHVVLAEALDPEVADDGGADPLRVAAPLDPSTAAARLTLRRPDGVRVPVAATAAPVRAPNGEVIGRVLVLRDITADLQVEQMKSQFLANVSHELRTPITPIKGYANVLARRDVGPEATRRFAEQILDSTRRLERIVGMIVDFAALDGGRVVLRREPVDVEALVGGRLERWREAEPERRFLCRLDPRLPQVLADPTYLGRMLDELLDNAVKFSPDGQEVEVTACRDGEVVELRVRDRGIGVDPDAARALFTDFVQLDGTETRHFGGLGLGLGLVKRILDGMGAEARVTSEPGAGTTVAVRLPADPSPPPPRQPARAATVPSPPV